MDTINTDLLPLPLPDLLLLTPHLVPPEVLVFSILLHHHPLPTVDQLILLVGLLTLGSNQNVESSRVSSTIKSIRAVHIRIPLSSICIDWNQVSMNASSHSIILPTLHSSVLKEIL